MKIAVIIPIYNQERCLGRALDSLAAQTFRDFVVIGVNDGSTDATADILSDYRAHGTLDLMVRTKPNGGVSSARNVGLEAALAIREVTHVAFLDPDDAYHPQCLEIAAHFIARDPTALYEWEIAECDFPEPARLPRYQADELEERPFRGAPAVWNKVFPVKCLGEVRFYEEVSIAEDLAFVAEVRHRTHVRCCGIHAALTCYVKSSGSITRRPLTVADFDERRKVIRYLAEVFADDPVALEAFCRRGMFGMLKRFFRDIRKTVPGDRDIARAVFCAALRDLRACGGLRLRSFRPNDLKYYLLFLYMSWRVEACRKSQS